MRTKLLFLFLTLHSFFIVSQNDSINIKKLETEFYKAYPHIYSNQDSAYIYFNKALTISQQEKWHDQSANILSYIIFTSSYHYNLPVMKNNLDNLGSLLITQKDSLKKQKVYHVANSLYQLNLGNYYYKLKDYKRAKPWFLQLKNELKSANTTQENIDKLHSVYSFLAVIYTNENKYELAKNYCNKALQLLNNYPDFFEDISSKKMLLNNYLAKIYSNQKQYDSAINLLEKSVNFYQTKKTSDYTNSLISSYQALINNYILSNNSEKALSLLQKSESSYRKNDPFYKVLQELYGDIYLQQQNFDKALLTYQISLKLFKTYRNNKKHIDIALIYKKISEVYIKNKQFDKAYINIQNALQNCTFSSTSFSDENPLISNLITNSDVLEILHTKVIVLTGLYNKNQNISFLKKGLQTSLLALDILDILKPTLENKNDKQYLIDKVYPLYETTLNQLHILHQKTNDKKYLDTAFTVLEKSKSTQLLEAVNLSKAIKFKNIPEQIIDREQQLLATINSIETAIFTSESTEEKYQKLNTAKEQYNSFLDSVKVTYPKYHKLKYDYTTISLETVLNNTKTNEAKVSYFFGKHYIYIFSITKKNIDFSRIVNSESLQKELTTFYATVSNYKKKYNPTLGFSLYKKLLPLNVRNKTLLTVVPDGFLNYIPFEALSTQNQNNSYLVQNAATVYENSFTLLNEQEKLTHNNEENTILAIAPEFYKTSSKNVTRADFTPLIFNKREVRNIASVFNTDTILGKQASLLKLKNRFSKYPILHFATHASANDEFPDFSYLAFTPTKNEANLWYVKDIYNTELKANLVTLSACQTGIGKLEKGEGNISLARAFSYAGVGALVKSLWKVDDKSSSKLMSDFYKELSLGNNKTTALQIAKNNYLKNTVKELSHPFFWAGFVLNGNPQAIANSPTNYVVWVIALIFIILFLFRKKLVQFFK
ncbi:hypothetical protein WH52_04535 [Tenacibaculum holothuriorum]|uniref:CHAT domain-containing protein n=1 Tax=Tenacibaculum holothuriorum TaxID=1635173 RepID=A0A1Y2PEL1_9FLAO|nr:CHAT domain-containing protein [Tenacibaculum holothuriorum]OSY88936.1 hypothetical protein WH52_04535 [Tenacibaculum holothuriorum]